MTITSVIGSNKQYFFLPSRQLLISILAPGGFQEERTVESNLFEFFHRLLQLFSLFFLFGFGWALGGMIGGFL